MIIIKNKREIPKSYAKTFDGIMVIAFQKLQINIKNILKDTALVIVWSNNEEIDNSVLEHIKNSNIHNIKKYFFNYFEYNVSDIDRKKTFLKNMIFDIFQHKISDNDLDSFYKHIIKHLHEQKQLEPVLPRANKKKRKSIEKYFKNYNKYLYSDFYKKEYERMTKNEQ